LFCSTPEGTRIAARPPGANDLSASAVNALSLLEQFRILCSFFGKIGVNGLTKGRIHQYAVE